MDSVTNPVIFPLSTVTPSAVTLPPVMLPVVEKLPAVTAPLAVSVPVATLVRPLTSVARPARRQRSRRDARQAAYFRRKADAVFIDNDVPILFGFRRDRFSRDIDAVTRTVFGDIQLANGSSYLVIYVLFIRCISIFCDRCCRQTADFSVLNSDLRAGATDFDGTINSNVTLQCNAVRTDGQIISIHFDRHAVRADFDAVTGFYGDRLIFSGRRSSYLLRSCCRQQ